MVENEAGGISQHKQHKQKQLLVNRSGSSVDGFEIERGCLLYINQLSENSLLKDNATFLCRIIILHKRYLTDTLRSDLLAGLPDDRASIVVFCYEGKHGKHPDSTFVGIDMQLNWLSRQIIQHDVPNGSLLAEMFSGKPLAHVDNHVAFSRIDITGLIDQLNGKQPITYFYLKYYFYGVMIQCFNRLLLDKPHFPRSDLDISNEAQQILKALAFMNQSLHENFRVYTSWRL